MVQMGSLDHLSTMTSRAVICSAQQKLPAATSEPASHGDLGGSGCTTDVKDHGDLCMECEY